MNNLRKKLRIVKYTGHRLVIREGFSKKLHILKDLDIDFKATKMETASERLRTRHAGARLPALRKMMMIRKDFGGRILGISKISKITGFSKKP